MKTTRTGERKLEQLSPFELKNNLIALASESAHRRSRTMLNAGRGNPNWIATTPREAFFMLGWFGLEECRRTFDRTEGMAGIPEKKGIGNRFERFVAGNAQLPGVSLLEEVYRYGIDRHGFDADEWALELAEGIIGDQYPFPVRMLPHAEAIVHDYLVREMCGGKTKAGGRYDLFATEGGTAAICYIFDSLVENFLLKKGDRIALGVPAFTPYLEIPELARYGFRVVHIEGSARDGDGNATFQYPGSELDKLKDPAIKGFFVINPSNPTSVMMDRRSMEYLASVVKHHNPELMIITDDVYGTFVPGFRSLMDLLPHNTLCVYSFSKYFGATGWRLGVIALHEDNIYDRMLARLSQRDQARVAKLYRNLTLTPSKLKFIDRLVADSRRVALNHTAGLSLPQQMQMMLFAGFALLDRDDTYKKSCIKLIGDRYALLWNGLELPVIPDANRAGYYCEFDMMDWAVRHHGKGFAAYLKKHFEPVDIVFRLAEETSVVLLNGGGFAGPEWSVRVSLANLDDEEYTSIGRSLAKVLDEYAGMWKKENKVISNN